MEAVSKDMINKLSEIGEDFFTPDCLWRDQISLSETFRTIYGDKRARATWVYLAKLRKPTKFDYIDKSAVITELGGNDERFILAAFTFETQSHGLPASHMGFLNIVPGPQGFDSWRVWSIQTGIENIIGHEAFDLRKIYPDPERDIFPSSDIGLATNRNYRDYIQQAKAKSNGTHTNGMHSINEQFDRKRLDAHDIVNDIRNVDVIIVGGGQAGLSTAGYCKSLELDAVIVEKNNEIGDNWTNRYASLYLHTPHRFSEILFTARYTNAHCITLCRRFSFWTYF